MAINSKNKGNAFERRVANMLSERFHTVTGIDKAFRRNSDSGSYFGGSNASRTDTHDTSKATFGDIICPNGFRFTLECKHYKTPPTLSSIIGQKCRQIDQWIVQAERDAASSGLSPLIVLKYNNAPIWVIVSQSVWQRPAVVYTDYVIVSLDDLLQREDGFFFEQCI